MRRKKKKCPVFVYTLEGRNSHRHLHGILKTKRQQTKSVRAAWQQSRSRAWGWDCRELSHDQTRRPVQILLVGVNTSPPGVTILGRHIQQRSQRTNAAQSFPTGLAVNALNSTTDLVSLQKYACHKTSLKTSGGPQGWQRCSYGRKGNVNEFIKYSHILKTAIMILL